MATTRSSRTIKKLERFLDSLDDEVPVAAAPTVPPSAEKKRVAGIMQRKGAKLLTSQEVAVPPPSKKRALGSKTAPVFKEENEEEEEKPQKKARTTTTKVKVEKKIAEEEDVPAANPEPKPKKTSSSKKKDVGNITNARLFEEVANQSVEEQLKAWTFSISKLKADDLKVLCKENNLMTKGNKIEIVERLSKSRLHGRYLDIPFKHSFTPLYLARGIRDTTAGHPLITSFHSLIFVFWWSSYLR